MKKYFIFIFVMIIFSYFGCKKITNKKDTIMKNSMQELVNFLEKKTKVIKIGDEKGPLIVILPEIGAKIIGMSIDGLKGENLLWISDSLLNESYWKKPDWNIGGARTWISPEDQFYLDNSNNWFVPSNMDPGKYVEELSDKNSIQCSNTFEINDKNNNHYKVKITRKIEIINSPQENIKPDKYNFSFAGFTFTHELQNIDSKTIGKDIPYMGLWSLIQLNANGTMIIPIKEVKDKRGENYRNFFNIFTPDRISVKSNNITVKMDGKFRGKIGIAPWAAKELLAYLYDIKNDEAILFIKNFSVNPEGKYLDKPWGKESSYGDAVEIYNDDGKMGGFCEMECHAEAKELKQNEKISHTITFTAFKGKKSDLKDFALKLLKISPENIIFYN